MSIERYIENFLVPMRRARKSEPDYKYGDVIVAGQWISIRWVAIHRPDSDASGELSSTEISICEVAVIGEDDKWIDYRTVPMEIQSSIEDHIENREWWDAEKSKEEDF